MTRVDSTRLTEAQLVALHSVLERHVGQKGALLPILHDVQHELGFIHAEAIPLIADSVNLSRAEVHGVVSYYHDFQTEPQPPYRIQICRAEACQARGGEGLLEHALQHLGCDEKQVSKDGRFSVAAAYCLGLCASSPALMLNEVPLARVSFESFDRLVSDVGSSA